jgi:hypothetical protein
MSAEILSFPFGDRATGGKPGDGQGNLGGACNVHELPAARAVIDGDAGILVQPGESYRAVGGFEYVNTHAHAVRLVFNPALGRFMPPSDEDDAHAVRFVTFETVDAYLVLLDDLLARDAALKHAAARGTTYGDTRALWSTDAQKALHNLRAEGRHIHGLPALVSRALMIHALLGAIAPEGCENIGKADCLSDAAEVNADLKSRLAETALVKTVAVPPGLAAREAESGAEPVVASFLLLHAEACSAIYHLWEAARSLRGLAGGALGALLAGLRNRFDIVAGLRKRFDVPADLLAAHRPAHLAPPPSRRPRLVHSGTLRRSEAAVMRIEADDFLHPPHDDDFPRGAA